MKSFPRLSMLLLLGAHAIEEGADMTLRELRGHGGRGHGGGHGGNKRNHTHGNMTEWLNETCTANSIVCSEVAADVLANCTNFTDHGRWHHGKDGSSEDGSSEDGSSGDQDWDRDLLVINEAVSTEAGFADLLELYDLFVGEIEEQMDEIPSTELRGSVHGFGERDLKKKRRHGGGGRHGGHGGKFGKWGNLTDAEIEELKLRRLTCWCCKDYSG
ncbi:hypothetical protein ACHAWX_002236 [Stephanocyclus meneghinianus]